MGNRVLLWRLSGLREITEYTTKKRGGDDLFWRCFVKNDLEGIQPPFGRFWGARRTLSLYMSSFDDATASLKSRQLPAREDQTKFLEKQEGTLHLEVPLWDCQIPWIRGLGMGGLLQGNLDRQKRRVCTRLAQDLTVRGHQPTTASKRCTLIGAAIGGG